MDRVFDFTDDLGPSKVIHLHGPRTGLKAVLVVDNVAAGPSIGGVRMAEDATVQEAFRLARAMTLKNAAAGLRHGGGKSVIIANPALDSAEKEGLIRAFALAVRDIREYIPGPDMGTNEECMAWIHDEIGRAAGLPKELGGIPLDEIGATGFGLAISSEVACERIGLPLEGARVAVQGFGAVGKHAARFLADRGAVLVAASDSKGMVTDPRGLPVQELVEHKGTGRAVADFPGGRAGPRDAVVDVGCDFWIPAARPDVLRMDSVVRLRTRLVLEGANVPVTREAEDALWQKGVFYIPDFIANAGGVICAAMEYHGGTQTMAYEAIEEKIRSNTRETLERAYTGHGISPRRAAEDLALERVRKAMQWTRLG
jgi:glutamate dehydrogenase/leucine dehydrogenase